MSAHALMLFLDFSILIGSALIIAKLYNTGLYTGYPVFFCYFLFRIPNSTWPLFLSFKSSAYFYFWVFSTPVAWVFYILVVRELYGLVLSKHRGLATLGRWAMYAGVAVSVTLSILSLLPKFTRNTPQHSRIIGIVVGTERGVTLALGLFLILMLFFLSRYPVLLGRNVLVHATLYTLFFLGNSLSHLLRTVFGLTLYTAIDTGLMGLAAACVFGWLFLLTPKGEEVQVSLPRYHPEQEERILYHLDALNATLLRAGRK